ncbi:alpha/beta hydrolase [Dyadobacter sp. CY312]|uniref:alpha/beta hydrolase n=1 Tax=Dyadobacter sp. CY312 TaxID=2907303 RepID=UPI001F167060|nr:alpha/beta hydrolase [Dyadobacter sp. CY312]MCE7039613.1 alpha/beta hydrolase [Dyadobacter sp. CY312]
MFRNSVSLCALVLGCTSAFAQIQPTGIPDTSFTIKSSYEKELKYHPNIKVANPAVPASVTVLQNVPYSTVSKDRKLLLDIYRDKDNKTKVPAILMIFGGGWRSGDRTHNATLGKQLAAKGFVTLTADYRLSTEALFPAAVNDLKTAVRWIRANGSKHGIDTSRIAVLGFSAGGELAAFLGATNGNKKYDGSQENAGYSSDVHAVIDIDGTLSFVHPESGEGNDSKSISAGTYWFGYPKKERPDLWEEASPLKHVSAKTPPYLFINSSVDRMHAGREDFIKKLNEFGTYSTIKSFPDAPHTFMFFDPWFEPTLVAINGFMNHVFPVSKPAK